MIRHVSVLTFAADVRTDQIDAIDAALATLPRVIPQLQAYAHGRDLALADTNGSYAVVADFASVDDYVAYRDNPEHQRILAEVIKPVLAARAAVQYEIS